MTVAFFRPICHNIVKDEIPQTAGGEMSHEPKSCHFK